MKDVISKVTFGFLMAQFVPCAIVLYSIAQLYIAAAQLVIGTPSALVAAAIGLCGDSLGSQIAFTLLAVAAGMGIHFFFVIGRIPMASLFKAERALT